MKLNGIVPAKAGGAGAGVVIAGAGKGGAVGGLRGTGGVEGYKGGGIRKAGGTGKKGKTFVEDTEAMMEILEMVNVGKEKVIETKLEKGVRYPEYGG